MVLIWFDEGLPAVALSGYRESQMSLWIHICKTNESYTADQLRATLAWRRYSFLNEWRVDYVDCGLLIMWIVRLFSRFTDRLLIWLLFSLSGFPVAAHCVIVGLLGLSRWWGIVSLPLSLHGIEQVLLYFCLLFLSLSIVFVGHSQLIPTNQLTGGSYAS